MNVLLSPPGPTELIIIVIILFLPMSLTVVAWWKIFEKAGFNVALSLLMIVPIVNLILPLYIAFADWPILKNKEDVKN